MVAKKQLLIIGEISKSTNRKIDDLIIELRSNSCIGTLSKAIPNHILLTTFPVKDVDSIVARLHKVATEHKAFEVEFHSLGIYDKEVLYLVPSFSKPLSELHDALALSTEINWHPRTPIYRDEPNMIMKALPIAQRHMDYYLEKSEEKSYKVTINAISIYESSPAYLVDKAKLLSQDE